MQDFQSLCQQRRSYRKYTSQPVEQEKLDYIMRCALMSPAGKRMNPWHFVVIKNEEILRQLAGCRTYGSGMFDTAMAGIVVAADTSVIDTWQCDAAIAAQNIWLAAADQGLGACWCHVYQREVIIIQQKIGKLRPFLGERRDSTALLRRKRSSTGSRVAFLGVFGLFGKQERGTTEPF